jgi:acetylornithine deacetylase
VIKGKSMGLSYYGSPTLSDQALMPYISVKIGPGQSSRSHTADEYIELDEIKHGIKTYIELLSGLEL